ncbi:hypothetical protein HBB16_02015 [Pseudonocardia sp. MCCB 268]|nr:hypothetical protein [Pseudonocardia cytotoxica]
MLTNDLMTGVLRARRRRLPDAIGSRRAAVRSRCRSTRDVVRSPVVRSLEWAGTWAPGGAAATAWTAPSWTLRDWSSPRCAARGMDVERDRNGNLWAWWLPAAGRDWLALSSPSYLDLVPDGGAFDGLFRVVRRRSPSTRCGPRSGPRVPIGVVAFSDEEGARVRRRRCVIVRGQF